MPGFHFKCTRNIRTMNHQGISISSRKIKLLGWWIKNKARGKINKLNRIENDLPSEQTIGRMRRHDRPPMCRRSSRGHPPLRRTWGLPVRAPVLALARCPWKTNSGWAELRKSFNKHDDLTKSDRWRNVRRCVDGILIRRRASKLRAEGKSYVLPNFFKKIERESKEY